jgi:hypothetical protein
VDLHRKRSQVVALDPTGEVVLSRRIGNAPAEFWRRFGELEPEPVAVVFEPPPAGGWSADLLADAGIGAHMAPAGHQAIAAARITNDPVDAKPLAQLLGTNLLAEAWIAHPTPVPPAGWSAPAGLVGMRSWVQSQLHALLADLGIIPELTTRFGPAGRRWLAELGMPASARARLDAGLRLLHAITVEINHTDADLRACFAGDHRVRRLLPIPRHRAGDRGHRGRRGLGPPALPRTGAAVPWPGSPRGSAQRHPDPPRPQHQTGSRWRRWTLLEAATSAVHDPAAGPLHHPDRPARGPRSPGERWPGGCSPCAPTPCATTAAAVPTPPPRSPAAWSGALGGCHGLAVQRPPA